MYEFPDELWDIIKTFQLDYKKKHKIKMTSTFEEIEGKFGPIFATWTEWPLKHNTNDIIRERYIHWHPDIMMIPRPHLELSSITWNNGWWCEYGWIDRSK